MGKKISLYPSDELFERICTHLEHLTTLGQVSKSSFILDLIKKYLDEVEGEEKGVRSS